MINKLIFYILLFAFSFNCLAAPYSGTWIRPSSGYLHTNDGIFPLLMLGALGAFFYYKMALEWIKQKKNHRKLILPSTIEDWIEFFIITIGVSILGSCLLGALVDLIWGRDLVRVVFPYIWCVLFAIAAFLALALN